MAKEEQIESIAYCGLVCVGCSHTRSGCPGCRKEGGDENCHQRTCCVEKGLDGCWQCDDFPCDEGYFANEEWKGLCIGLVECIKGMGVEKFLAQVEARMGETIEYGNYRFKSAEGIRALLE